MNKLIDLTKVLKAGDKVYSVLTGEYITVSKINNNSIDFNNGSNRSILGQFWNEKTRPNGECIIFPSKTQRDWQKYIDDKAEEQERADLLD